MTTQTDTFFPRLGGNSEFTRYIASVAEGSSRLLERVLPSQQGSSTTTILGPFEADRIAGVRPWLIRVASAVRVSQASGSMFIDHVIYTPGAWVVMSAVEQRLHELLALPANWDSYDADQITPHAIYVASSVVKQALGEYPLSNDPGDISINIVPLNDGGVQIEWDGPHGRLDVEVDPEEYTFNFLLIRPDGSPDRFEERHGVSSEDVLEALGEILDKE